MPVGKGYQRVHRVDLIDRDESWLYDSAAFDEFLGGAFENQLAGNFSFVQLRNPAASGIHLFIKSILVANLHAARIDLRNHAAQLAVAGATTPKYFTAAVANCEVRRGTAVALVGAAIAVVAVGVNIPVQLLSAGPLILVENQGIVVASGAVNQGVTAYFEWIERPI